MRRWAIVLVGFSPWPGLAVDFSIDLPAHGGLTLGPDAADLWDLPAPAEPPRTRGPVLGRNSAEPTRPAPPPPPRLPKGSAKDPHFPELPCLRNNVRFWVRVYRDLGDDEGLLHDRDDPGRVFAAVRLTQGRGEEETAAVKRLYAQKLESAAAKLQRGAALDSRDMQVVQVFAPGERTPGHLRASIPRLRLQTGLKGRFRAGVQRSLTHLPAIRRILHSHQLPLGIAHLPHVESSFQPAARSKVGAAGLWQLMPDTMRSLLGRGSVHLRTHPEVSTRAAAKLLRQNYARTGSWPLALTAYNHGLGGVLAGMNQTGSRDLCELISGYKSPSFKFASMNFYAQFLAARKVANAAYANL